MKHNYSLPHVIIQQREFRTAKMEPGTYSLPKEEVIRCQALAYRVLRRAGIHFPRESAFYALISFLNDIEKNENHFNDWEKFLFSTLFNAQFKTSTENQNPNQYWYIHASRFRLLKNKIGRNIFSRYSTSPDKGESKNSNE